MQHTGIHMYVYTYIYIYIHTDVKRDMHCYNRHAADRRPDRDTVHYYERHAVDGVTRDVKYTHMTDREGRERS